jgi:uncharacterized protein (TIGR02466 family)
MTTLMSGDFAFAFPALIFQRRLPQVDALNVQLREALLALRSQGPGITRSNVGAWHSDYSFFSGEEPAVVALRRLIQPAMLEYWSMDQQRSVQPQELSFTMVGWAMAYQRGDYAAPHAHPACSFSGVYYVDAGTAASDHPKSGVLSCLDPRMALNSMAPGWAQSSSFDIVPQSGLLVLFPAWLVHHVHPYYGDAERISISFNVSAQVAASRTSTAPQR